MKCIKIVRKLKYANKWNAFHAKMRIVLNVAYIAAYWECSAFWIIDFQDINRAEL